MKEMQTKKLGLRPGDNIDDSCRDAVAMAIDENCHVEINFNGFPLLATPTTDPATLAKSYMDDCNRRHEEYINSQEYKDLQEKTAREEAERKVKVDLILTDSPKTMTLRDPEGWEKAKAANTDPYGGAIMTFAERWAMLMEIFINKGGKIPDIADECCSLADEEGITGFMYGAAVSTLAHVWIHGEELQTWHRRNA